MIRPDPQVMVRVDDRQLRLEDRLALGPGQPRLVGRMDPAVLRRRQDASTGSCQAGLSVSASPCPGRAVSVMREAARRRSGVVAAGGRPKFIAGARKMRTAAPPSVGQVASAAESRAGRETSNCRPHTVHWKG